MCHLKKTIKDKCTAWKTTKLCSKEFLKWILAGFRKALYPETYKREESEIFISILQRNSQKKFFYNVRLGLIGWIGTL